MARKLTMWGALAAVLVAACSGDATKKLSVSARTDSGPAATASLDLGNGLTLDRIRVVVRRIELEGARGTCAPPPPAPPPAPPATPPPPATTEKDAVASGDHGDSGSDDHGGGSGHDGSDDGDDGEHDGEDGDDCEFRFGPFLVDLAGTDLTSGVRPQFDVAVPAGTYHELEFKVGTIDAGRAAAAPVEAQRAGLAEMAAKRASIVLNGTRDGTPFELALAVELEHEREGGIVVDPANGAAVTFDLSPAGWLTAPDGSALDPSDPADLSAILANVRASIRVEHDEDHDGHDDERDDD